MSDHLSRLSVGSRVVIRHRLREPDRLTGATLNDVVGALVAVGPDTVTVDTSRGRVVLARDTVTLSKTIPPRPGRRGRPHRAIGIADLERIMVNGHPPNERESLGDWSLRAAGGYTGRANSLLPTGDPGLPLEDAVRQMESWYAARGLPSNVQLAFPEGAGPQDDPLGSLLLGRGYAVSPEVLVMTVDPREVPAAPLPRGVRLDAEQTVTPEFLAHCGPRVRDAGEAAAAVLSGPPDQALLLARTEVSGAIVGVARVPFHDAWAGIFGVFVQREHRHTGIGGALTAAAALEAAHRGVVAAYLQVEETNTGAIALYERAGFTTHHRYAYLTHPASAEVVGMRSKRRPQRA